MGDLILSRANFQPNPTPLPDIERVVAAGFAVEAIDEHKYQVDDNFLFWPATHYWRSLDRKQFGYGCGTLIEAARIFRATRPQQ